MRQLKITKKPSNNGVPKINQYDSGNQDAIQEFNNGQIYTKGFTRTTAASSTNEFNLELGGKPRQIHGIVIFFPAANANDNDIISLLINSETVIDKVNWKSYSPISTGNTFKPDQFYELRRALSGSDSVQLNVNSAGAHDVFIVFYLSNR